MCFPVVCPDDLGSTWHALQAVQCYRVFVETERVVEHEDFVSKGHLRVVGVCVWGGVPIVGAFIFMNSFSFSC